MAYAAAMATASETFTPAVTPPIPPSSISPAPLAAPMVLHTHASYPLAHLVTGKYWLDLQPGDLHRNLSDTGWAKAAYSNLFGPWRMGAAVFIQHSTGRFDAQETLRLLEQHGITTSVPHIIYRMMVLEDLQRYNLTQLRHCGGGRWSLNLEVIAAWRAGTGLTIYDGYGQTETTILVANYPCMEVKPGSMGKPAPGFDVATSMPTPAPARQARGRHCHPCQATVPCGPVPGILEEPEEPSSPSEGNGTSPGTAVCETPRAISGLWVGLTT